MASKGAARILFWSALAAMLVLLWGPLVGGGRRVQACLNDERVLAPPDPSQAAMSDRLAKPVLGESPTQVEVGRYLYYYNCMPCHGDRGQGLTEEWRQVWVEDHQNCWARGCHTGKSELAAFYIPRAVPPLVGLSHFPTAEALFSFLRDTQPPQRPGTLTAAEYWAVTAFLLYQNGRLSPDEEIGPPAALAYTVANDTVLGAVLAILLALGAGASLDRGGCKIAG